MAARPDRAARGRTHDPFLLVLVVLAVLKAWLMRWLTLGSANPLLALVLETAAIVLFLGLADLIWPRRSHLADVAVYAFACFVMFSNAMYVAYYDLIFDVRLIAAANQVGSVKDIIAELLRPIHALFFLDWPLVAAWAVGMRMRSRAGRLASERSMRVMAATALALVVFGVQMLLVTRVPSSADSTAVAELRGVAAYQIAGALRRPAKASAVASVEPTATVDENLSPAERFQRRIEAVRGADDGPRIAGFKPGAYKGSSVIIVQFEALQDMLVNAKIDGAEITPNVNALAEESWYFPNMFSQIAGGNTADAEYALVTSLLPPRGKAASIEYADRELTSLPRLLGERGYRSITLHQNQAEYWNRKELYPALGYSAYYDRESLPKKDNMWRGASDEVLFAEGAKVLESLEASDTPFFSLFVTLSSHAPFRYVPPARRPLKISSATQRSSKMGEYTTALSYTDMAFGKFVAQLKKSGLYDSCILVVLGDHMGIKDISPEGGDKELLDEILGRPYTYADRQRVPLIIHLPKQREPRRVDAVVGMTDFMPTLADPLGIDLSATPHVGRDAFREGYELVPTRTYFPGGAFVNSRVVFLPKLSFDDGRAIDVVTGEPAEVTEAERRDFENARLLGELADEWARGLPVRPDAGGREGAIIPKDL
ncbi:MAG: LTA synthase family protein [Actinomycetota bacterium]|nr:LTA synthase family protein [Actinomycetota bacterium]